MGTERVLFFIELFAVVYSAVSRFSHELSCSLKGVRLSVKTIAVVGRTVVSMVVRHGERTDKPVLMLPVQVGTWYQYFRTFMGDFDRLLYTTRYNTAVNL